MGRARQGGETSVHLLIVVDFCRLRRVGQNPDITVVDLGIRMIGSRLKRSTLEPDMQLRV